MAKTFTQRAGGVETAEPPKAGSDRYEIRCGSKLLNTAATDKLAVREVTAATHSGTYALDRQTGMTFLKGGDGWGHHDLRKNEFLICLSTGERFFQYSKHHAERAVREQRNHPELDCRAIDIHRDLVYRSPETGWQPVQESDFPKGYVKPAK